MAVCARYDEIGVLAARAIDQFLRREIGDLGPHVEVSRNAVQSEIVAYVMGTLLGSLLSDAYDGHSLGALEERQSIPDGASRFPRVAPGDDDVLGRKLGHVGRRDEQRTPEIHDEIGRVERHPALRRVE